MHRALVLALTLALGTGGVACCKRPGKIKLKPGPPGAAATATATTFAPDARFPPIPAAERTLRVVTRGGLALNVTTPPASLSEDRCEPFGEGGYRLFGINNHGGIGGWAVAGITGAGEYPLTGENGPVIVDVEMNANNESVGAHKVLSDGILRVEQLSISGRKARFRAAAFGKAKTDSGKSVDVQVAFHITTAAPQP